MGSKKSAKKSDEEGEIIVMRLNTTAYGASAEYIVGKVVKGLLYNIIRAALFLEPKEKMIPLGNDQFEKTFIKEKRWEFYIDDYFTDSDEGASFKEMGVLWRPLEDDEILYESYFTTIDNHRLEQAKIKAQEELIKKQAEAATQKDNRAQRRNAQKNSGKKNKKKSKRSSKHTTH